MESYKYDQSLHKFDVTPFLESAKQLVEYDEVIRALSILNNLPAYFRDNPPKEVLALKNLIQSKILTVYDIKSNIWDLPSFHNKENMHLILDGSTRGRILKDAVKKYNDGEIVPHIVDLGPGPYYFPIALKHFCFKFTYESKNINGPAEEEAKKELGEIFSCQPKEDQPIIFVACELIEHLFNEDDIRYVFDKVASKKMPEVIILSTPNYTFHPYGNDWIKDGLSHLRAYTPVEFVNKVSVMFPEYSLSLGTESVLTIVGVLK